MARLDKLLTGHTITDEYFIRTGSTALGLTHDTIRVVADLVIRTAAGGGGTLLSLTTDYTVSDEDTVLSAEAGVSVYRKVAIVNGTYQNVALYASYKTCGDYVTAALATPVGSMTMYAGSSIPAGWFLCDGTAKSRLVYAELYAAIGTAWGVGDGSTTFNLPDMREACPQGAGTWASVTGTTHGAITAHDARALAAFADDQEQAHWHEIVSKDQPAIGQKRAASFGAGAGISLSDCNLSDGSRIQAYTMISDGTNGTPRVGTVTRGKTIGVNYIIKY
jgi:microcystin-dependent protein